jgi:hypothetical protein
MGQRPGHAPIRKAEAPELRKAPVENFKAARNATGVILQTERPRPGVDLSEDVLLPLLGRTTIEDVRSGYELRTLVAPYPSEESNLSAMYL